jgi:hypothetical protein
LLDKESEKEVSHEIMALNVMPLRVLTFQAVERFIGRMQKKATTA